VSQNDRLSQIHTLWSVVKRAHDDDADAARQAQQKLLDEYSGAARRYLLGALRSEDAADEAFQEFSLRFVRGDFKNVSPEKGKFRSFLKTCLYHLIIDQQRHQKKAKAAAPLEFDPAAREAEESVADDAQFTRSWREDLLSRAWARLAEDEASSGKPYNTVLRTRSEHPSVQSPELAELVSQRLKREITSANVRVLLHRARELFAEFLLRAVIDSLEDSRRDLVEEELIELQLLDYCRSALDGMNAAPIGVGGNSSLPPPNRTGGSPASGSPVEGSPS
jgi:DNA-directed RNA polymerase specialized sigma24 family protein